MVRILVGTLLDVGAGKTRVDSIPEILAAKDRSKAGFTAEPEGLYLWNVVYEDFESNGGNTPFHTIFS
jgi:tRNA pseudouridine38-40 synthase